MFGCMNKKKTARKQSFVSAIDILFNNNLLNINLVAVDDSYEICASGEVMVEHLVFTISYIDVASFNYCAVCIDNLVGCITLNVAEVDAEHTVVRIRVDCH